MIGHDVLKEIVSKIPNIWAKVKKSLHVTCDVGCGIAVSTWKRIVAVEHYMAEVE